MKTWTKMSLSTFLLALFIVSVFGCDGSPVEPQDTASVEGQVTDSEGQEGFYKTASGIEGAVVTLAKVNSDGGFSTVSNDSVTTDASGRFTIETDLDNVSNLIIIAHKGNSSWRGIINSKVEHNTTIQTAPLTIETTAEADVYAELYARGQTDEFVAAEVQAEVNSSIAVEVINSQPAYEKLVVSIEDHIEAENAAVSSSSIGGSDADINAMAAARIQAQIQLNQSLYSAGLNQDQIDAAMQNYNSARMQIYSDVGFDSEARAKIVEMSNRAFLVTSGLADAEVERAMRQVAKYRTAVVVDAALQAEFTAMGASETQLQAVASLGTTLRTSLMEAQTANAVSQTFATYHDSIITRFEAVVQSETNIPAGVVTQLDADIRSGAWAGMNNSIDNAVTNLIDVNINTIVSAFSSFFGAVRTSVTDNTDIYNNATNAQTDIVVSTLILANLGG